MNGAAAAREDTGDTTGRTRARATRTPTWMGLAFAVATFMILFGQLSEVGLTWDEGRYFESAARMQDWTSELVSGDFQGALSPSSIREAWDSDRYYNPHPPVYKEAMALSEALLGEHFGPLTAFRAANLLMFAVLVGLVVAVTGHLTRPAAGFAAGAALLLMPRAVGHAHVAATDMPLTLFWFVATMGLFGYIRTDNSRWLVAGGVALGLGFATKFTGFLAPVPLIVWIILFARVRRSRRALVYGLALAALVAVLVNPAAWIDPIGYQVRLIGESLGRSAIIPISTYYLGRSYIFVVPWHQAIVMTVATVPVATLALAVLALKTVIRRGATRPLAALCVIQVVFWWTLLALPGSPNHDGVRLWLPMFPFVAMLAGIGFGVLAGALKRRVAGAPSTAGLMLLGTVYFFPALLATLRTSPYYLSYYSEVVGGPSGAARAGFEATYWFDAVTADFRARLEELLPRGAVVRAEPNYQIYQQLQELGLLRSDLRFTNEDPADYFLLLARKAMFKAELTRLYRTVRPLLAVELDGVELVGLYDWTGDPSSQEP